ncbi:hypothetical protein ACFSCX_05370 [Bacillus salitolerans]|uniref:Uncharacterized protein n=1 Tax=Bacillus salitolerans TaxID=1437434 RepID=A0ABW4LLD9_9BACI
MIKKTGNEYSDLLEQELLEAGVPMLNGLDGKPMNPTNVLVNHSISAKPFINILLNYAQRK